MADADSGDILLVAAGDGAASARLIARWRRPVFALFSAYKEPSAATESAVELFSELHQTSGKYKPETPFPIWIHSLAHRVFQVDSPVRPLSLSNERLRESPASRVALLKSAAASLPADERAAFLFTRVSRLPLGSVARALHTSEAEIRRSLVRGMEALVGALRPLLEGVEATLANQPERLPEAEEVSQAEDFEREPFGPSS